MSDGGWIRRTVDGAKGWIRRLQEPEKFGHPDELEPLELRRAILRDVANAVRVAGWKRRILPGNHLRILIPVKDEARRRVLERALVAEDDLARRIRQQLGRVDVHEELAIEINLMEGSAEELGGRPYTLEWSDAASVTDQLPLLELKVVRGRAGKKTYVFDQQEVRVGRLREVEDASGRILHRNDLAFEQEDEHGRSVSRRHALFFRDGIGFRVCDLTSAGGTWILRDGRNIKVSSRVDEGIGLRDGDLVYLAQAGVQVKLKPRPKLPEQRSPPST